MNVMDFPLSLGFEDVGIVQKKNICKSRLDVNIKSEIARGLFIENPLICSNMSSIINSQFYNKIYELGGLAVLHRALDTRLYIEEVKKVADKCKIVAVSIGTQEDQFDLCRTLIDNGANFIIIDVAHGYSDTVINLGRKIKKEFNEVKLGVGNVTNVSFLEEVDDFADVVKCGIGGGLACSTKNTAGAFQKQFSTIFQFKELSKKLGLPILADGAIREPADFVKSIGAGANSAMAGSIFCMCPESSAEETEINGVRKKIYYGMASRRNQEQWRKGLKPKTCAEGRVVYLDLGEPVADLIERYMGALRSGITYAGANDIKSFQDQVEFVRFV